MPVFLTGTIILLLRTTLPTSPAAIREPLVPAAATLLSPVLKIKSYPPLAAEVWEVTILLSLFLFLIFA